MERLPKVVVIGGGTGSFALLSDLKNFPCEITSLVNMADDGGSTGVLRDELGVLPPGDVRQCLVALSESRESMRELFNYRFSDGTFKGHSFGNLFLSAVEKMTDNFDAAVELASEVLKIKGKVVPVTMDNCKLMLDRLGQEPLAGQYQIEVSDFDGRSKPHIYFENPATLNPHAAKAIAEADLVVIAPGNLYISLVPSLIVQGMSQALADCSAKVVYVANLVNKPQHTHSFAFQDYVEEMERFVGAPVIDYVLFNQDTPDTETLKTYALDGEFPIPSDPARLHGLHYQVIPGNFLSRKIHARNPNNSFIVRSLIRHDGEAVSRAIFEILKKDGQ